MSKINMVHNIEPLTREHGVLRGLNTPLGEFYTFNEHCLKNFPLKDHVFE